MARAHRPDRNRRHNVDHATAHGVSIIEIISAFEGKVFRNKSGRTADYYVIGNGIRVNFIYREGVARPISAWKVRS